MITLITLANGALNHPDNNGLYNIKLWAIDENDKLTSVFITDENGEVQIITPDQFNNGEVIDAVDEVSIQCITSEEAHVVYDKLIADVGILNDGINTSAVI